MDQLDGYIAKAAAELSTKSLRQIQAETARVWCGRACASNNPTDATEYAHESIEHAALCGDDNLLRAIRQKLIQYGIRL